jgi:hypothetical protein
MRLMNALAPPELRRAVDALWRVVEPTPSNLYAAPAFDGLLQVCQALYPNVGSDQALKFALGHALSGLGFRWTADCPSQRAVPADIAADKIDAAFRQTRSRRIHLCPLDRADKIPGRRFGPNSIRKFTAAELNSLVDPHGATRKWPDSHFDSERFAEFSWLVVEEYLALPGAPGRRALPNLFKGLTEDFGRIEPHKPLFPPQVEAALFALLTAPWEDVTLYSDFDWHLFVFRGCTRSTMTFSPALLCRQTPPVSPGKLIFIRIVTTNRLSSSGHRNCHLATMPRRRQIT